MITFEELHQRAETIYILDKIDAITKEEKEFLVDQLRKDWDLPPMIREVKIRPQANPLIM